MRIPTPSDFRAIENWGLIEDPLAAVEDYSEKKEKRRCENERHCRARDEYQENQSEEFIRDSQAYYRSMDRPIDRTKWEYLKRRKAWFNPPLGWDQFSSPGVSRILDLGCGDGDITQRVADHVAASWLRAGYDGFPLEIIGVDLSQSRVHNARQHTTTPHDKITLKFAQGDALDGLKYKDRYFDYTLLVGLLEILDDRQTRTVLSEVGRLTSYGVYVRDVLDEYPGLAPRPDLPSTLSNYGFTTEPQERVFEEPFVEEGSKDPLSIWPMNVNQVIFAERDDPPPHADRY